jgi:spore maturation protein A
MNVVFPLVFLLSALYFLLFAPDSFLPALLSGAQKAATLSLSLVAVYAVWMGFGGVVEACGGNRFLAKKLDSAVKKLFSVSDEKTAEYITVNLSANMLGLSGVATPFGIKAANSLKGATHARISASMLLVVNATSIQLLPTTAMALLISFQAKNPVAILLPSFLSSAFTTVLGVILVKLFIRKE